MQGGSGGKNRSLTVPYSEHTSVRRFVICISPHPVWIPYVLAKISHGFACRTRYVSSITTIAAKLIADDVSSHAVVCPA